MSEDFRLRDWTVRPHQNCICRGDTEVKIDPKAMQVLVYLAEHSNEIVLKERIIETVWEGAFVTDEVLTNAVWELRKALGDDAKTPQFIQTVPRKGYRLIATVEGAPTVSSADLTPASWRRAIPWGVAGLVAILVTALFIRGSIREGPASEPSLARLRLSTPPFVQVYRPNLALSPDGNLLAFVAEGNGTTQLYLRAMDELDATPIEETDGALSPFFSPDGKWIAFFAEDKLKKVSVAGGEPVTLCSAPSSRGASWGLDDRIYFRSTRSAWSGLSWVPAVGGEPQAATTTGEGESHRWPQVLPGGKMVLVTVFDRRLNTPDRATIGVVSLETGEYRTLVERGGHFARYAATGHLIYAREGALQAAPFDLGRLELTSPPSPVLEGVLTSIVNGSSQFAFSDSGTLAYIPGSGVPETMLVWVDREGNAQPVTGERRAFTFPRISPDGRTIAVEVYTEANYDVWIHDTARGTLTRLTSSPSDEDLPIWTPDGSRVTFMSNRNGPNNLFWKPADGSGRTEKLLESELEHWPRSWSPDGSILAYEQVDPGKIDIFMLSMKSRGKSEPFLDAPFMEREAEFSPDGRWIAYVSDETGRFEVYLRPYPDPGRKWQISTDGGFEPAWSPDGRELFYRTSDKMMVVPLSLTPEISPGKPSVLFDDRFERGGIMARNYDIAPDGQRFVMIERENMAPPTEVILVFNWGEELKRLVPTN